MEEDERTLEELQLASDGRNVLLRAAGCVSWLRTQAPKPCGEFELDYWWLDRPGSASLASLGRLSSSADANR